MRKILQIIFIGIMLAFFASPIIEANTNKDQRMIIAQKIHYYVNYWVNYYGLDKKLDILTKQKITKQIIEKYEYRIINLESQFKPNTKNWEPTIGCYSYGLTRLTPVTAKDEGWNFKNEKELFNIDKNLKYGIKHFCRKVAKHHSIKRGIAAYNAGGVYYVRDSEQQKYINQTYVDIVFYNSNNMDDIKFQKNI